LQVAREHDVLDVGPQDLHAVAGGDRLDVPQDVFAELVAVGEDLLKRHRGQRPPGGELHVAVEPVLVAGDPLDRRGRIDHPVLGDDADPQRDLVGREDLLALDEEFALAHVDQYDIDLRPPAPEHRRTRKLVVARFQDLVEPAVDVAQPTVRAADGYFVCRGHGYHLREERVAP
jgi:hypothetical protein